MLPRSSRLPSSEFLGQGYRTVRMPHFSLKIRRNSLPKSRIGVIISVAAIKTAARRNFWKRQVKSFIVKQQFFIVDHLDILVIFSKQKDVLMAGAFKTEMKKAFITAGVLHE